MIIAARPGPLPTRRPPPHTLPRHLHPPPVADQRPRPGGFRDGQEADGARLRSVQLFQAEGPGAGIEAEGAADHPEEERREVLCPHLSAGQDLALVVSKTVLATIVRKAELKVA